MRKLVKNSLIFLLLANIIPGVVVTSLKAVILLAIIYAVISSIVVPIVKLLALPVNLLTFGFFNWVIDAFGLYLASSLVPGFYIPSMSTAIFMALALSVINSLINNPKKER